KNNMFTQAWNQRLPPNYTAEKMKKRFQDANEKPNSAILAIETTEGVLVGNINYSESTPRFDATFGIAMGKEHWGKGLAEEAQELLLEFLFVERGIQIVRLWTQGGFPWAEKAAKKLGFRPMVRFRDNTIIDGKIVDTIYMDILREEYFSSRKREDEVKGP
ncbi:MAG: GNAT family N-acetyltransferase, partial [Candidatus Thermoplasmatota archaeon]|nr:GNAT family N-acetyltransferase [Candidatus Thermoplasmatota archaeon]